MATIVRGQITIVVIILEEEEEKLLEVVEASNGTAEKRLKAG